VKAAQIRGSTIVVALLLGALAVAVALGMLSRRVGQRYLANSTPRQAQARALAWAGLEDARGKLMKSRSFPPLSGLNSRLFGYSEQLRDASGKQVGTYLVELELPSHDLVVVHCSAVLRGEDQVALSLRGELDVAASRNYVDLSSGVDIPMARAFRWLRVEGTEFANI
jgi:hypothetical protein